MYGRVIEIMIGIWLLMSPFIFGHPADQTWFWVNDFAVGLLLITTSSLSIREATRRLYVLNLVWGAWLVGWGYFYWPAVPIPAALQNDILVGLIVLMLGLVPPEASQPPRGWRRLRPLEPRNGARRH